MWKPAFKKSWAPSPLRERLNEYLRKKEKEEGFLECQSRYRSQGSFIVNLIKSLHSNLLVKLTIVVLVLLFASLMSNWHHPLALRITDNIQYITTWDINVGGLEQEIAPVMRNLWSGNFEERAVDLTDTKNEGDWQQDIEASKIMPPLEGDVTEGYGLRFHPLWGRKEMHYGIDFTASSVAEVLAPAKGKVARIEEHLYYNKLLFVDHGNDWISVYGHLQEIKVAVDEIVEKGQVISTIEEKPPGGEKRLHFELRHRGYPVDPMPYLIENL